jgi:hypothetical protein
MTSQTGLTRQAASLVLPAVPPVIVVVVVVIAIVRHKQQHDVVYELSSAVHASYSVCKNRLLVFRLCVGQKLTV